MKIDALIESDRGKKACLRLCPSGYVVLGL